MLERLTKVFKYLVSNWPTIVAMLSMLGFSGYSYNESTSKDATIQSMDDKLTELTLKMQPSLSTKRTVIVNKTDYSKINKVIEDRVLKGFIEYDIKHRAKWH